MKFNIEVAHPVTDLGRIEDALLAIDPAAMIDADAAGLHLRVASTLDAGELVQLVTKAGYAIGGSGIVGVRSECCGGCGG